MGRKILSERENFFVNEISRLLEINRNAVKCYKAAHKHKFATYEELYKEFERRLWVANKLSEFLVDKTIHDIKDFFGGTYRAKYDRSLKFFTSLYCLDKSCKVDARFYKNCLIVLQNIKLEENPCNY